MKSPLVSIVTPVYNNGRCLSSFIESVISQSYTNWELILVDDGSVDNSFFICERYRKIDSRIRVICHATNGGISKARNTGIIHSCGEWLFISDADDTLFKDSIRDLVNLISDGVDLVSAKYLRYVDGVFQPEVKESRSSVMSIREYTEAIGILPQSRNLERYVWNKLFKSSIIKENSLFFYDDLKLFEDVCFVYQYLECCRNHVVCTAVPVYSYYRRTDGTAMSNRNHYKDRTLSWLLAYTRIFAIVERMGASSSTKKRVKDEILGIYHHISSLIRREGQSKEEKSSCPNFVLLFIFGYLLF